MISRNPKSLLALIETCRTLEELTKFHAKSIISGLCYNQFVLRKVASSFLTPHCLGYATKVFDRTSERGTWVYNVMIKAYSSSEIPIVAISMYNKLRDKEGVVGDNFTYPFVFKACASLHAVDKGKETHGVIVKIGYELDRFLKSSLLNFYTVCGEIDSARRVFDEFYAKDVVFWNALIMGYGRARMVLEAFEVFGLMIKVPQLDPNEGTILGLISACAESKNLKFGRLIHGFVIKEKSFSTDLKLGAALIDMYVKCKSLDDAKLVFKDMPVKNTVAWNSLICGYSQMGSLQEAAVLFREMWLSNVIPDKFTISGMLSACARGGAINLGNWVRQFSEKNRIWDVFIGTSLVDMYAKCGFLRVAREIFDQMPNRTVATWNVILSGYASHGQAESAVELFDEMRKAGPRPDSVTFLAILHACAHAGLVDHGKQYFEIMREFYNINPNIEHCGCMVDLYGRAGLLQEAKNLINKMKIEPNVIVWGALLSACSVHGDVEIGEWAAHHILKLDAVDGGSYVLLANMYAAARRFDGVKAIREIMSERGILKQPGCSMIEIGDVVHEFVVADKMHPRCKDIYTLLDELNGKLKAAGYVPTVALDEEGFIT